MIIFHNKPMSLSEAWAKVPASWKAEATSIWHTFVAAFVVEIGLSAQNADIEWTGDFVKALAFAALRSGIKAVFMLIYSQVQAWKK